jgi:hypothetical protein
VNPVAIMRPEVFCCNEWNVANWHLVNFWDFGTLGLKMKFDNFINVTCILV